MKYKLLFVILTLIITGTRTIAAHQYLEKEYQSQWCTANKGITEKILQDGARVDCITNEYAIEFDFANKWAESVGQALYYSISLNKPAGIVLIMENPQKDERYLKRLNAVAQKYNIKVWTMTPSDMACKEAFEK